MTEAISVCDATGDDVDAESFDALEGRRREPRPRRDDLRRIEPKMRATLESFLVSVVAALVLLERTWLDASAACAASTEGEELGCPSPRDSSSICDMAEGRCGRGFCASSACSAIVKTGADAGAGS